MMKYNNIILGYYLIHCIFSCASKVEQNPTYQAYTTLYSQTLPDSIKFIIDKSNDEPVMLQEFIRIDSGWNVQLGDSLENLIEPFKIVKGAAVSLPHYVNLPDRALWYSKDINFTETGVLTISADDGAQLYVNGNPVLRLRDQFFPVDTTGVLNITIRVLNNAMSGGLHRVSFSTNQQVAEYDVDLNIQLRLKALVQKVALMNNPTQEQWKLVRTALENPEEEKISSAEIAFSNLPYLIGPWLQIKDSSRWVVNVLSEGNLPVVLTYGSSSKNLAHKIVKEGKMISFEIVNGIDDKLYYQLSSGRTVTPVYSFQRHNESFSFNVWADSQSGWLAFRKNVLNSLETLDAFGIGVGDLVSNGSDEEQWKVLFNELSASSALVPYYLIAGNHDYDGYYDNLKAKNYVELTNHQTAAYFSWTYNNCAFIALNPNEEFPIGITENSEQFNWFKSQLQSNEWKRASWRFVLLHQPPYSQGWPGYHGDQVIRNLLEPNIESAKIDFIVSGHTHDYERLQKNYGNQQVTYLVVGGAGGSLEPEQSSIYPKMDTIIKTHHWGRFFIEGHSIRFEVRNQANEIIDSFKRIR